MFVTFQSGPVASVSECFEDLHPDCVSSTVPSLNLLRTRHSRWSDIYLVLSQHLQSPCRKIRGDRYAIITSSIVYARCCVCVDLCTIHRCSVHLPLFLELVPFPYSRHTSVPPSVDTHPPCSTALTPHAFADFQPARLPPRGSLQVALVHENEVGVDNLSRMFGGRILCRGSVVVPPLVGADLGGTV